MSDLSPRERRQERTRQTILDTALLLIKEKGLTKLSLREIARRIDYSPAGLYEYFASKDEIIEAVVQDANERFFNHLNQVALDLPTERYLIELGGLYVDFARRYPDHFLLMFTQFPARLPVSLAEFHPSAETDSYGLLLQAVQRAIDEKLFKTQANYSLIEITYSLWAFVHGMAMLQVTYLREVAWDFESTNRQALQNFIQGLKQT